MKKARYNLTILGLALCTASGLESDAQAATEKDPHAGHAHNQTTPCEGESVQRIPVTEEQITRMGVKITTAAKGVVHKAIHVPGEIKINSDHMAHVVPQTPGVVLKVSAVLGQKVKKGEILALISSRGLAQIKAEYLASVEHVKLAQETFAREKLLYEKKVTAEQDFLTASQALSEKKIRERSARQKLSTLGLSSTSLTNLLSEPEEQFALYEITSPFDGTVIRKHVVLGEVIDERTEIFVVADLSTVWVDLAISQDTIGSVKEGYSTTVRLPDGSEADTKLSFISPVVSPETRTALARATLRNPDGAFRPGTFIAASIHVPSREEGVVVPRSSVQLIHDHPCVFVWGQADFEVREVQTGVSDGNQIEILQGLRAGESVASVNAFHLKAEFIKSAAGDLGAHHGHSH